MDTWYITGVLLQFEFLFSGCVVHVSSFFGGLCYEDLQCTFKIAEDAPKLAVVYLYGFSEVEVC